MSDFESSSSSYAAASGGENTTAAAAAAAIAEDDCWEALEKRQKAEVRKLDGEIRALLKTAKKSTKRQIECQAVQMQFDLKAKHSEEIEQFEERNIGAVDNAEDKGSSDAVAAKTTTGVSTGIGTATTNELNTDAAAVVAAKKAKAKAKKDRKAAKEVEAALQLQQEREVLQSAGPTARDVELRRINAQLAAHSLVVKSIPADGNCLYRAIEDQLSYTNSSSSNMSAANACHNSSYSINSNNICSNGSGSSNGNSSSRGATTGGLNHYALRVVAADYMRSHSDEFSPFLGVAADSSDYCCYCDRVASATLAEWGGQLELKALAAALQRTILVYSADAPVLVMQATTAAEEIAAVGEQLVPLRVTYHRHYYALGEHYNSVGSLLDDRMAQLSVNPAATTAVQDAATDNDS